MRIREVLSRLARYSPVALLPQTVSFRASSVPELALRASTLTAGPDLGGFLFMDVVRYDPVPNAGSHTFVAKR